MHPLKRRKLDQPLFHNKPFRSPLRAATKPQGNPTTDTAEAQWSPSSNSTIPQRRSQDYSDSASDVPLASAAIGIDALQKDYTALSVRLTQLRQSLEIAEQALRIEASGQDSELKKLIVKWRAVAQETADELFTDAKARVDSMGGVVAWRRQAKSDSQSWHDEKENVAHTAISNSDAVRDHMDSGALDEHDLPNCAENEEQSVSQGWSHTFSVRTNFTFSQYFTMETMLHQMNVDLQAIGFDKQLGRWVE